MYYYNTYFFNVNSFDKTFFCHLLIDVQYCYISSYITFIEKQAMKALLFSYCEPKYEVKKYFHKCRFLFSFSTYKKTHLTVELVGSYFNLIYLDFLYASNRFLNHGQQLLRLNPADHGVNGYLHEFFVQRGCRFDVVLLTDMCQRIV